MAHLDAFEEYVKGYPQPYKPSQNAITFAQEIEHTKPDLAAFIYDMAAIPAMSAECERVFSSAKLLLRDQRARLKPILIETYECLRHWLLNTKDDILKRNPPRYDKDVVEEERKIAEEEGEIVNGRSSEDNSDSDDSGDEFMGSYEVLDDKM